MNRTVPNTGPIDFGRWLGRLVSWDGVLPIGIILAPSAIEWLIPNRRGPIEFASVALPIVGFLIRFVAGKRQIESNNCGPRCRKFQFAALALGVFSLVFIDAIAMLIHLAPNRPLFAGVMVYASLSPIYLAPMIVALYPGRAKPLPEVFRPEAG